MLVCKPPRLEGPEVRIEVELLHLAHERETRLRFVVDPAHRLHRVLSKTAALRSFADIPNRHSVPQAIGRARAPAERPIFTEQFAEPAPSCAAIFERDANRQRRRQQCTRRDESAGNCVVIPYRRSATVASARTPNADRDRHQSSRTRKTLASASIHRPARRPPARGIEHRDHREVTLARARVHAKAARPPSRIATGVEAQPRSADRRAQKQSGCASRLRTSNTRMLGVPAAQWPGANNQRSSAIAPASNAESARTTAARPSAVRQRPNSARVSASTRYAAVHERDRRRALLPRQRILRATVREAVLAHRVAPVGVDRAFDRTRSCRNMDTRSMRGDRMRAHTAFGAVHRGRLRARAALQLAVSRDRLAQSRREGRGVQAREARTRARVANAEGPRGAR